MRCVLLALILLGALPEQNTLKVIIRPGDTPERIKEIYLRSGHSWESLSELNNPLNPNCLLNIPLDLLKEGLFPRIICVYGETAIIPKNQTSQVPAQAGTIIEDGDSIKAFIHGGIALRFSGERRLILRGPGEFTVLGSRKEGTCQIRLDEGRLEVEWPETPLKKHHLEIITQGLVARAEDANFRIAVGDNGEVKLEVLKGTVTAQIGDQQIQLSPEHGLVIPFRGTGG